MAVALWLVTLKKVLKKPHNHKNQKKLHTHGSPPSFFDFSPRNEVRLFDTSEGFAAKTTVETPGLKSANNTSASPSLSSGTSSRPGRPLPAMGKASRQLKELCLETNTSVTGLTSPPLLSN